MINWKIEKRNIEELRGYDKNPRKFTDKGLKDLKKSLQNCGDANIITINADNTVLGGHARLTVMKQLGYKDGRTVNHWWSKSQFALPTRENYEALREYGKKVLKDYDFLKKDYDELKKDFYAGRSFFDNTHDNMNNVWHFPKTSQEERKETGGHATPKPIALCSRAIKSSSRENETVLDVFGGSGSTLIACEQLNRKCFMMELDEHYCDVIITRWENLTGQKAVLNE